METEEKKYLVNVESNLDKYAKDAAKAAEEVDKLTIENVKLKGSSTASKEEIEKSNASLRSAKKEYTESKKLVDLQTQANNSNINSRKQLNAIVTLEQRRLGALANTYTINEKGVRVLSQSYIEQVKRLTEAKQAVIEYDKAQKDGRSSVGLYSEAIDESSSKFGKLGASFEGVGNKIKDSFTQMIAGGAAIAGIAVIFGKLKDAIMSTSFAISAMNDVAEVSKQLFYDIAIQGKFSWDNIKTAFQAAEEFNDLRIEQYGVDLKLSRIQREINSLMLDATDINKDVTERMEKLNKVRELDTEQTVIETDALKKNLKATIDLLETRGDDAELQKQAYDLARQIEDAYAKSDQAMRRVESQQASARKQQQADFIKRNTYLKEGTEEYKKAVEELVKLMIAEQDLGNQVKMTAEEYRKAADEAIKYVENLELITQKELDLYSEKIATEVDADAKAMAAGQEIFAKNMAERNKQKDELKARDLAKEKEHQEKINGLINAGYAGLQSGADAVFSAKQNMRNAEMEAELSNQNLTEEQKLKIREKYFNEQKKADISQALINGALAIGNALATTKPFVPAGLIAGGLAAVQTAAQVAVIKSQQFSGGGSASTSIPTSMTPTVQRSFASPVSSSFFTQPQLSQSQLNATGQGEMLTAADIATALSNMPNPIVTVEDINAKTIAKNKVDVRATI